MNVKKELEGYIKEHYVDGDKMLSYLPDFEIHPDKIKAIMINEVVANDVKDDFYSDKKNPLYMETTIALFHAAGIEVEDIQEIIDAGIYITNAVKTPKDEYAIETAKIKDHAQILEKELALFENLEVVMLMGDVAKKAFNMITKKASKKNAVPSISTYKLRNSELYYDGKRIFPSYIMTGKNILIEKSKFQMASEDIFKMMDIIR
ncbi:hypothetical protein M2475_002205 [Breznakia sp. PF5-3]|uniref:uracil-DNA glycosylase family protein n=1 Tax=unclassified Breznakia TaxID=2623764 RepID=UPI002405C0D8|nr:MULTISPECIES: uracil-DNA glycosylase family protein [unclassified Breznakia]MDL2276722.1 uracil-DNA glycosylase family protein [Breznakia sp. OttesenSCG-928-G09]MDF9825819.1 hypothetical protein [Breznakia sp. PM6-1]MDF9836624.1 hypothetical protein [Breznakia sp. PF5-3]MDF9838853.1 hypothetical protein [Breznakia sp. PFB2-8]MDF9860879.1 hypothetical protein [Breznakia sp. PH5-24]